LIAGISNNEHRVKNKLEFNAILVDNPFPYPMRFSTSIALPLLVLITLARTPGSAQSRVLKEPSFQSISARQWKVQTQGSIRGSALAAGDRVYFGSADGNLYAVTRKSGDLVWKFKTAGAISGTPASANGVVYVASRDLNIYAVESATGKERWKFKTGELLPHAWGWEYFQSTPVIENDVLYVGAGDGVSYALQASDGRVLWKFKTNGRIRSTPVIHDKLVFVASYDGVLYVLDKTKGTLQWRYETEGAHLKSDDFGWDRNAIDATPVVTEGKLVLGSRDGSLYAVDIKTKALLWKFTYGATWCISSPLVQQGKVFVGWSDNKLFCAVDLQTGKEVWKYEAGDYVYSSPVIAGNTVMVGSGDNKLYGFDATTGKVQWTFKTQGSIYSSPVLDSATVYIGSDDGAMYALQGSSREPVQHVAFFATDLGHDYLKGNPKITTFLQSEKIQSLDSAGVKKFMNDRIKDKASSVLIFNHSSIPPSLLTPSEKSGTFRKYIETGGTVIWTGFAPNLVSFDDKGNFLGEKPDVANALLDMDFDLVHDGGEYSCAATAAGKRYGLSDFFVAHFSVKPGAVSETLAANEYGRPVCWVKKLGAGRFIQWRTWSNEIGQRDLDMLLDLAQFRP
jgi:outer membrane protein assembly factor BamB